MFACAPAVSVHAYAHVWARAQELRRERTQVTAGGSLLSHHPPAGAGRGLCREGLRSQLPKVPPKAGEAEREEAAPYLNAND